MIIKLVVIGKTNTDWLIKGIAEYTSRLMHYTNFEIIEIPEIKNKANLSIAKLKEAEQAAIQKYLAPNFYIVAMDEKGKGYTSEGFSTYLEKKMMDGIKQIVFIIGGAFGISANILETCHDKIALSDMTFSHQMVRLIFVEQLYRAFTIIKKEKYHHK